jgi:hypothetical protein
MTASTEATPGEFGRDLAQLREAAGVQMDAIVARTKIPRRTLEALEMGDFAQLPNRLFAGFFLRQYLEMVGETNPGPWVERFDQAWQHFLLGSQPLPALVMPAVPPASRVRLVPWVTGVLLVVAAMTAVLLVERRQGEQPGGLRHVPLPTPDVGVVVNGVDGTGFQISDPSPEPGDSLFRVVALDDPCWVEVAASDGPVHSRLLAPGEHWEIALGEGEVLVVLGDAGAAEISFRGEIVRRPGRSGQVVRLRFPTDSSPDGGVQP